MPGGAQGIVEGPLEVRVVRWLCILLASLVLQAQVPHGAGERTLRLQVLATADVHGQLMPEDTFTRRPADQGWAQLATLVRELQAHQPNTLLVDAGDGLQGQPVSYLRARVRPDLPEPSVAALASLGCHAAVVGNHDFDWGLPYLRRVDEEAIFPLLAANVVDGTGKPAFTPYVVQEVAGLRVGILGLTTSALERIAEPGVLGPLKVVDALETARNLVPRLRQEERLDLLVVVFHSGAGRSGAQPFEEHQGQTLAEGVPGIDLLVLGHSHSQEARTQRGVPILQPPPFGRGLGVAELDLRREGKHWKVDQARLRLETIRPGTETDPVVLSATSELRALADTYLDTRATELAMDLDGRWSRMEDSALVQLIHRVQREATGAQLSAAPSPGLRYFVPKGPVSVRALWALAPYENRVARIRVTGAQVRAWLEHAARYYQPSHQSRLYNPEVAGHDFDLLDGVDYALDLSRPVGSRVARLTRDGHPVRDDQVFTLALSTYRLNGGGGYLEAVGLKPGQAEFVSPATLRNLLLEYVLARPRLDIPLRNHWRTIPWLDRDRVLKQAM